MTLEETIKECLKQPELLEQYTRLNPPKEYLTVKKREAEFERHIFAYYNFIRDYIWLPLLNPKSKMNGLVK